MIRLPDPRDVALELARRIGSAQPVLDPAVRDRGELDVRRVYVVRAGNPPTQLERLQLRVARLQRSPFAIMPHPCKTMGDWLERYGQLNEP